MMTSATPAQPGRFDFGLNAEQESRAARLHHESIVFDMLSQHAGGNIFAHYPPAIQEQWHVLQRSIENTEELATKMLELIEPLTDPTAWS